MPATKTFWWTPAPFLRLLFSLISGILLGWHLALPAPVWMTAVAICFAAPLFYSLFPVAQQFRLRQIAGIFLLLLPLCLGGWLVAHHDVRNNKAWFAHHYNKETALVVVLSEAPVAKPRSYKATAQVQYFIQGKKAVPAKGSIILYFKKEAAAPPLAYGTRLLVRKPVQPVQNSGNPGAFDYKRYCLFGGITHQVFLAAPDFRVVNKGSGAAFTGFIIRSRLAIVAVLRKYIGGHQEQGLAEALLIGYKDDLDKSLVQAYSNTGVVHVIAISGLHLGIVYLLLAGLLKPMGNRSKLLRFFIIMLGLWGFAFLAGAQPSVLRSAVMFSCIALGELMARKSAVLNTLALSAFGLLCYNPFWLWDLGFQLSYAAVASILVFYKPLYRQLYFPNKAVDWVWQLVALTLTAQVFTLPISLYHFHQFPVLFLATNLLAVPLSSLILLGEILLCLLWWLPAAAAPLGHALETLIRFMNAYVLRLDGLPLALWDGFFLSSMQVVLLYIILGCAGYWLLEKRKKALFLSLSFLLLFTMLRSFYLLKAQGQQQLIVYNISKHSAADFICGRNVLFRGDASLLQESFEQKFHLKPARISLQAKNITAVAAPILQAGTKKIAFYTGQADRLFDLADVVVVSGKGVPPKPGHFNKSSIQVVLDATVPFYRSAQWRRLCSTVGWPLHDVKEKGAFVMKW
jgi:competence protein ComEC